MTFRVAAKGVTPFCRHPSDLSELGREPKLDHVTPVGALNFHKDAENLSLASDGSVEEAL